MDKEIDKKNKTSSVPFTVLMVVFYFPLTMDFYGALLF